MIVFFKGQEIDLDKGVFVNQSFKNRQTVTIGDDHYIVLENEDIITKNGCYTININNENNILGEVSNNQWHNITVEKSKGRFLLAWCNYKYIVKKIE